MAYARRTVGLESRKVTGQHEPGQWAQVGASMTVGVGIAVYFFRTCMACELEDEISLGSSCEWGQVHQALWFGHEFTGTVLISFLLL